MVKFQKMATMTATSVFASITTPNAFAVPSCERMFATRVVPAVFSMRLPNHTREYLYSMARFRLSVPLNVQL